MNSYDKTKIYYILTLHLIVGCTKLGVLSYVRQSGCAKLGAPKWVRKIGYAKLGASKWVR